MRPSTNFWMGVAGLVCLVAGIATRRGDIRAARGLERLVAAGSVFVAASIAAFAPEHFHGPQFVEDMVPSWMPGQQMWTPIVGIALLAAATSLTVRRLEALSTTLLGLMFFLFVCMIYLPSLVESPGERLAWVFALRDGSFCAGAWALAALHTRGSSPRRSAALLLFARCVIAAAGIFYGVEHVLHADIAPGVPLRKSMPSWVPIPAMWNYLTGAILLAGGLGVALNKHARLAAASIGAWLTALTAFVYLPLLVLALGGPADELNGALNYVADTLLFAGSALGLAQALPRSRS